MLSRTFMITALLVSILAVSMANENVVITSRQLGRSFKNQNILDRPVNTLCLGLSVDRRVLTLALFVPQEAPMILILIRNLRKSHPKGKSVALTGKSK